MSLAEGSVRRIDGGFWRGHLCTVVSGPNSAGYYTVHRKGDTKDLLFTEKLLKRKDEDIVQYNLSDGSPRFTGVK